LWGSDCYAGAIGYMYYGQTTDANLPMGAVGYVFWPAVISISLASIFTAKLGANISHSISEKGAKSLLWSIFNHGRNLGDSKLIIELSDFFNNPSLIEIGWLRIQYYAVTWVLSAVFIFQYLKTIALLGAAINC